MRVSRHHERAWMLEAFGASCKGLHWRHIVPDAAVDRDGCIDRLKGVGDGQEERSRPARGVRWREAMVRGTFALCFATSAGTVDDTAPSLAMRPRSSHSPRRLPVASWETRRGFQRRLAYTKLDVMEQTCHLSKVRSLERSAPRAPVV